MMMISHEIILNNAAGCRRNPPLPVVSLPGTGAVSPAAPATGSKQNESARERMPLSSTALNLASTSAANGNNRLKPSLYTARSLKTAFFETATRCSQILGCLSLMVGQLFPGIEALS
jgi:hypothetical protein